MLALFAVLAVVHTWPLITNPAVLSRNDNADTMLIEWSLAWVAHQLPRDPLHLFDANIFYPARYSLAFSEHLFVPALMGAPLQWLGASPVLVYNILLMAGFALTGWTTSLVIRAWTGDSWAGILGGCVVSFNAHTLTRLPHLQAMHTEFLPLALLSLDGVLRDPRLKEGLRLSGLFVLQALTSNYHMVFSAIALVASALARPLDWLRWQKRQALPVLLLAAVISAAAVFPFLLPYYHARETYGLVRTLDEVSMYAAKPDDYLSTGARIHYYTWGESFYSRSGSSLFPGFAALGLTALAVATGVAFKDARARMCLAFGIAGFLISFGTKLPGYYFLYQAFPLLQGIRGTNRLGFLVIIAVGMLAAFGLVWLRERFYGARWIGALSVALIALVNVEALRAPIWYKRFEGIPRIYDRLAAERTIAVAEFPFHAPQASARNAHYMVYSTRHWKPILNGHSAFIPGHYVRFHSELAGFPDPRSMNALRTAGVTHVVVHHHAFGRNLEGAHGLRLIASEDGITLYRLTR
jgi:hypothetical protein